MQKKRWLALLLLLVLCTASFAGCQKIEADQNVWLEEKESDFQIHVIDVGQGDSILVHSGGQTLLIDAGENEMGDRVVSYLKEQGVTSLDYVIGSHPHSDHIGGLDVVIDAMKVDKVILPAVSHTSRTFEDVLLAIKRKGKKITKPVAGTEYTLGDASFQIIAPNSAHYDDLNDYSVGVRVTYGSTHYVFAADADSVSEQEMVESKWNLSANVLKLNHHGSRYSNRKEFLDAVSPDYVVISVGKDNSYGHPHAEVMAELKRRKIPIYRTDETGTILITSDGSKVAFQAQPSKITDAVPVKPEKKKNQVYVTKTGTKFHKEGCSYLTQDAQSMPKEEALKEGYTACSRCFK